MAKGRDSDTKISKYREQGTAGRHIDLSPVNDDLYIAEARHRPCPQRSA